MAPEGSQTFLVPNDVCFNELHDRDDIIIANVADCTTVEISQSESNVTVASLGKISSKLA